MNTIYMIFKGIRFVLYLMNINKLHIQKKKEGIY